MIEHVVRRTTMCEASLRFMSRPADTEIRNVVQGFGGSIIMNVTRHERASDRVAEASK